MGLVFRALPTQDHGIDGEVELFEDNKATGRLIAVQVKTGQSYFRTENAETYAIGVKNRHYTYWRDHSLPVILILCDENTEICYWQYISEENCRLAGANYRLEVPKQQQLSSDSYSKIVELASPVIAASDYPIWW